MGARPPDEALRALGAAVKRVRVARGLTQERVAEAAGMHTTYLSDVERGRRNIGFINLTHLAAALDVDLPTLMQEVEAKRGR